MGQLGEAAPPLNQSHRLCAPNAVLVDTRGHLECPSRAFAVTPVSPCSEPLVCWLVSGSALVHQLVEGPLARTI